MDHQNIINIEQNEMYKSYIIRASFKDCSIADRKNFINSTCIIPISVGQKVHEGEKFIRTINLINKSFKDATLLVDDSIQRYTLAIDSGRNAQQEYEVALLYGEQWLERNIQYIEKMTIPYKIMRWDNFKNSDSYADKLNKIENLYTTDTQYRDEINNTIKEFLNRYMENKRDLNQIEYNRASRLCLDYLKEECACMCIWAEHNYNFEVYPTGRNHAMNITHEKLIKPQSPNLLKSVSIRFKKFYPKNLALTQQNPAMEA